MRWSKSRSMTTPPFQSGTSPLFSLLFALALMIFEWSLASSTDCCSGVNVPAFSASYNFWAFSFLLSFSAFRFSGLASANLALLSVTFQFAKWTYLSSGSFYRFLTQRCIPSLLSIGWSSNRIPSIIDDILLVIHYMLYDGGIVLKFWFRAIPGHFIVRERVLLPVT